jgi:membrane protein DedA with SNARE-associated domain
VIDGLLELVPQYGIYVVTLATFLSCLALPIPSSLIMLTAGAFVASGDLNIAGTAGMALIGAVLGDQAGFHIGARGGALLERMSGKGGKGGKSAQAIARANTLSQRWGGPGVFLSRWLLSPLGPYMNFVTGAAGMDWLRFTLWGAAGEAVWVTVYVGLGIVFGGQIEAVAEIAGSFSGALAAGAVTIGLGLLLRNALRAERRRHRRQD